jgi:hypothetical protein
MAMKGCWLHSPISWVVQILACPASPRPVENIPGHRDHHSGHRDHCSDDHDQLIGIIPERVIGIIPES